MNAVTIAPPLEITRQFDTSLTDLWKYWAEREFVGQWFAPGNMRCEVLEHDFRVGGTYRIRMHEEDGSMHTVGGQFIEIEIERRIVMSWRWEGSEGPASQVTADFSAHADGARLELLHEGFEIEETVAAHEEGWNDCLDQLAARTAG